MRARGAMGQQPAAEGAPAAAPAVAAKKDQ